MPVGRLVAVPVGVQVDVLVMVSVGDRVSVTLGGKGEKVSAGGTVGDASARAGAATDPRSQAINRSGRKRKRRRCMGMILQ